MPRSGARQGRQATGKEPCRAHDEERRSGKSIADARIVRARAHRAAVDDGRGAYESHDAVRKVATEVVVDVPSARYRRRKGERPEEEEDEESDRCGARVRADGGPSGGGVLVGCASRGFGTRRSGRRAGAAGGRRRRDGSPGRARGTSSPSRPAPCGRAGSETAGSRSPPGGLEHSGLTGFSAKRPSRALGAGARHPVPCRGGQVSRDRQTPLPRNGS